MAWINTLFAYLNPFNWVGRQTFPPRRRYDLRRTLRHRTHRTFFFHLPLLGAGAGTKRRHDSDPPPQRKTRVRFADPDSSTLTRAGDACSEDSYTSTDEQAADASDASSLASESDNIPEWNSDTDEVDPPSPTDSFIARLSSSRRYATYTPARTARPAILEDIPTTCPPNTRTDPQAAARWHNLIRAEEHTRGWPTEDAELYAHLALRGNEPLMPSKWEVDFPTLPGRLFVPQPEDPGFVPSAQLPVLHALGWDQKAGKEARAVRVLQDLVDVGCYVRDLMHTSTHRRTSTLSKGQTSAETAQRRAIVAAIEWGLKDADVAPEVRGTHLPCLLVLQAEGESTVVLKERCVRELRELREAWRASLMSGRTDAGANVVPPVYAILCRGCRMVFVALEDRKEVHSSRPFEDGGRDEDADVEGGSQADSHLSELEDLDADEPQSTPSSSNAAPAPTTDAQAQQPLRIIDIYDWSKEEGQDVWIGVSVMMLAVHARDLMVEWYGFRDPRAAVSDVEGDGIDEEHGDDGGEAPGHDAAVDEEDGNEDPEDQALSSEDGEVDGEHVMSGALAVERDDEGPERDGASGRGGFTSVEDLGSDE